MRNVTVTLEDEVVQWAKVRAAKEDTSVSRMLGELLRERMLGERRYQRAMDTWLRARPRRLKRAGPYPRREAVHERARVR
jgi:plasmid stability protein